MQANQCGHRIVSANQQGKTLAMNDSLRVHRKAASRLKPQQGKRQRLRGNPLNFSVLTRTGQDAAIGISQDLFETFGSDLSSPFDFHGEKAALVNIGDIHFARSLNVKGGKISSIMGYDACFDQTGRVIRIGERGDYLPAIGIVIRP
jgi:hypothetical protein